MIKAKGKADRAAARAAAAAPSVSAAPRPSVSVASSAHPSQEALVEAPPTSSASLNQTPPGAQGADSQTQPTGGAAEADAPAMSEREKEKERERDKLLARVNALKERPELSRRFMRSMVPILVDVYAASVALQVRSRSLSGLLKAISWLDGNDLSRTLRVSWTVFKKSLSLTIFD